MSSRNIDRLCELWAESLHRSMPSFTDNKELNSTIDSTQLGDVPWESFKLKFNGEWPAGDVPPWMDHTYKFWFCPAYSLVSQILSNMDFHGEFDYVPYRDFLKDDEQRRYENFMSVSAIIKKEESPLVVPLLFEETGDAKKEDRQSPSLSSYRTRSPIEPARGYTPRPPSIYNPSTPVRSPSPLPEPIDWEQILVIPRRSPASDNGSSTIVESIGGILH
ncbi:hypothetical protein OG21DRAFT_1484934 [Imleria badia]|nr:hypothetical protein OG21DRAFT_1484934 [Imleria badia]